MDDMFDVIPCKSVNVLEEKLDKIFSPQRVFDQASNLLATDPNNAELQADLATAVAQSEVANMELEGMPLAPLNLAKNYRGITEAKLSRSNRYYLQYGSDYSVENLAWSNDRLLNTYEEPLRHKI